MLSSPSSHVFWCYCIGLVELQVYGRSFGWELLARFLFTPAQEDTYESDFVVALLLYPMFPVPSAGRLTAVSGVTATGRHLPLLLLLLLLLLFPLLLTSKMMQSIS